MPSSGSQMRVTTVRCGAVILVSDGENVMVGGSDAAPVAVKLPAALAILPPDVYDAHKSTFFVQPMSPGEPYVTGTATVAPPAIVTVDPLLSDGGGQVWYPASVL